MISLIQFFVLCLSRAYSILLIYLDSQAPFTYVPCTWHKHLATEYLTLYSYDVCYLFGSICYLKLGMYW